MQNYFFPPLLRARGVKEGDLRQSRFPFADFRPAHDKLQTTFFFGSHETKWSITVFQFLLSLNMLHPLPELSIQLAFCSFVSVRGLVPLHDH